MTHMLPLVKKYVTMYTHLNLLILVQIEVQSHLGL